MIAWYILHLLHVLGNMRAKLQEPSLAHSFQQGHRCKASWRCASCISICFCCVILCTKTNTAGVLVTGSCINTAFSSQGILAQQRSFGSVWMPATLTTSAVQMQAARHTQTQTYTHSHTDVDTPVQTQRASELQAHTLTVMGHISIMDHFCWPFFLLI